MSLELKKGDQIIFVVDKSGSMGERDPKCGGDTKDKWMGETLAAYVKAAANFDPDGVSIYFFSSNVETHTDVSTPEEAIDLAKKHKTGGGTNTHLALEAAWKEHAKKGNTSTYVLVFTDGEASDRDALKREIVQITKRVNDPEEFRIVFLPIGTVNSELAGFLDDLDENLTGAAYDIVAIVKPDEADFEGAIANTIGGTTDSNDVADGHATTGKKTTTVS